MADQKLTALTELLAPISTDLFYAVDDPGGTPLSRRVTIGNVLDIVTGDIKVDSSGISTYNPLSIVNADVSATAKFLFSKLEAGTKGDLPISNGTNFIKVGVGADTFVLTADAAEASGVKWAAAGGGENHLGLLSTDIDDPTTDTEFNGIMGTRQVFGASEPRVQTTMPRAATFSRLGIRITANAQVVDSNLRFRINAADGNLNVVIGAALTGVFKDTSNTDAVVVDDEVAIKLTQDSAFNFDTRATFVEYI